MCLSSEKKLLLKQSFFVLCIITLGFWGIEIYASAKQSRRPLTEMTKKSITVVLEANEALHSSFFKYDAKTVETNALKLKKAIEMIKDKEIAKLLNFSKTKLTQIKVSNDRETNNRNYNLVSMALIHIINKYDVGSKYNAYSCPMVKKKWVQNSSKMGKVHNPYAPSMPHCGSQDSHH